MDITVSFSHDESCAEVTLEGVDCHMPEVLADIFTREVDALLRLEIQSRVINGDG